MTGDTVTNDANGISDASIVCAVNVNLIRIFA